MVARLMAVVALAVATATVAQADEPKHGGILHIYHRETPPSLSIHEEATFSVNVPAMGLFNNLVIYDQHKPQNSMGDIVPELATSWAWDSAGTALTFKLREGVTWHDGKPFTAKDVKCTFDLLQDKAQDKFRKNPRRDLFNNIADVTVNGDYEVVLHLKRPQPSLLAMIASGYTPMYPCHLTPAQMRTHPIGTGPYKFVEFKQNESIKLARNDNYWKKGLPYLDGVEFTIISNREKPPFDSIELRKAMALALDRKSFIDIIFQGQADAGGTLLPPPEGVWGMPPEMLKTIPGYGDVNKDREQARAIMAKLGYGPNNPLKIKVSTRNLATYRDPAVVLIDQLKTINIDAELDLVESSQWFAKIARNDYSVGLNLTGNGVDDPDQAFYENYACGSERNYTHYCNKELEALFDKQSVETDIEKRKKMVWDIDKKLQEDVARPILMHARSGTCWKPYVKNMTIMSNSAYNGYRYEDVWLDK